MKFLRRARLQASMAALQNPIPNRCRSWTAFYSQIPELEGSDSGNPAITTPASLKRKEGSPKCFVQHAFYKSKSVLRIRPGGPTFRVLESGDTVMKREGCLFLEFAPAVGTKEYDWNRKQIFALSVDELGSLMALRPNEGCEFFHDPHIGKSEARKVRKTLKVEPKQDMSGYFFNYARLDAIENVNERISVLVSKSEFMVMKSISNYIIPHLMGWDTAMNPHRPLHVIGDSCETAELKGELTSNPETEESE